VNVRSSSLKSALNHYYILLFRRFSLFLRYLSTIKHSCRISSNKSISKYLINSRLDILMFVYFIFFELLNFIVNIFNRSSLRLFKTNIEWKKILFRSSASSKSTKYCLLWAILITLWIRMKIKFSLKFFWKTWSFFLILS